MEAHGSARLLFVYGTLRSDAKGILGRRERGLLHQQARLVGSASVPARLYDLGEYPGLVRVAAGATAPMVQGELLELYNPSRTFLWLDAYEGVSANGGRPEDEYRRELSPAFLSATRHQTAWVYVMRQLPANTRMIATGQWR